MLPLVRCRGVRRAGLTRLLYLGMGLLLAMGGPAAAAGYAFGVNGLDFSLSSYRLDERGELRHLGHRPMGKSPPAIEVHPSGRFVLALSKTADTIAVHRFNPLDGELTPVPGSPFPTHARSPFAIAFHPSGRFVYVAARFSGVGAYAFDLQTGALTPLAGSPYPAQERTRSLVMHPSGRFLYAINGYSNSISAYAVDPRSGGLTALPGSPWSLGDRGNINYSALGMEDVPAGAGGIPYDIATDPRGRFLYVANWAAASVSVFRVDENTGTPTAVAGSPFFVGFNPYRLRVHPSGRFLYVALYASNEVSVQGIDADSGTLTPVAGSPFASGGEGPVALRFSDDGRRLYVSNYDTSEIALLDVAPATGAVSLRQRIGTRFGPWDLALIEGLDEAPVAAPSALLVAQGEAGVGLFDVTEGGGSSRANAVLDGPAQIAVASPDARFVYVADPDAGTVTGFARGPAGLQPLAGGVVQVGQAPVELMIDGHGWYLYAVNADDTLLAWRIDPVSGVPRAVMRKPARTGAQPVAVVQDPAMRYNFVVNAGSNSVSVFYAYNNRMPLVIDTQRYGSPYATGKTPVALAVEPNGRYAYVANAGSNDVSAYRIHHKTGALSALPGSPFRSGEHPVDLAVDGSGRWLYVASRAEASIAIHAIEGGLGALAPDVRRLKLPVRPARLQMDAAGRTLWVLAEGGRRLVRLAIDEATGELTLLKVEALKRPITDLSLAGAGSRR